jgi:hypothetical protein
VVKTTGEGVYNRKEKTNKGNDQIANKKVDSSTDSCGAETETLWHAENMPVSRGD